MIEQERKENFTLQDILALLPHRYPFLMIDRVLGYEENVWIKAVKNVSNNEPHFTGHFPGKPVMPGVMIVESLAQAGAILAYLSMKTTPKESLFYLASLEQAKFKRIVEPGDQLELNIKMGPKKRDFWKLEGEATVEGDLACRVTILSAMRNIAS